MAHGHQAEGKCVGTADRLDKLQLSAHGWHFINLRNNAMLVIQMSQVWAEARCWVHLDLSMLAMQGNSHCRFFVCGCTYDKGVHTTHACGEMVQGVIAI